MSDPFVEPPSPKWTPVKVVAPYCGPIPTMERSVWLVASIVADPNGCANHGEVYARCDRPDLAYEIANLMNWAIHYHG